MDQAFARILVEFGYKAHEQGKNLELTLKEFDTLMAPQLKFPEPTAPIRLANDPRFTDQDREAMWDYFLDEANDMSHKDMAEILMEGADLIELIGAVFPKDVEDVARMLEIMTTEDDGHINGEFLRAHDDDGDDYASMLDFAKRMKLISDDEETVTDLGREFISTYLDLSVR
jgi:AcrR family transcriptional regulator